jgi:hypothetical protein
MSYRNIEVEDKTYQWTAGKTNVHIKGGNLKQPINFKKTEVGEKIEWVCDCCGTPMSQLGYKSDEIRFNFAVTPKIVRDLILAYIH